MHPGHAGGRQHRRARVLLESGMPLCVVHICGPAGSGKTELARRVARRLEPEQPHHLRLVRWDGDGPDFLTAVVPMDGMYESRRCTYSPARIFEQLPAALRSIKQVRRWGTVLLETDTDPCHRQAFEYGARVFVAPAPGDLFEVFRTPQQARAAFHRIMQDTLVFASEIFGLTPDKVLDESRYGLSSLSDSTVLAAPAAAMSDTDMGRIQSTSVGRDLAMRIQLQPDYYAICESDVVLINTARGACHAGVDGIARRIELMQSQLPRPAGRQPMLAVCDLCDDSDPMQRQALERIKSLIDEAKADWPEPAV